MLPIVSCFKELIKTGENAQKSALTCLVWGTDDLVQGLGTARISHVNTGFDLLQGKYPVWGEFSERLPWISLLNHLWQLSIREQHGALPKIQTLPWLIRLGRKDSFVRNKRREAEPENFKNGAGFERNWGIWGHQWARSEKPMGEAFYDDKSNEHRWQYQCL